MCALHSLVRPTERRSLATQLSSRRDSAVGGFNPPARIVFRQRESPGEPVMNYYQPTLTTSIAVLVVRRVAGQ
jgi:hypothetical protein